MKILVVSDLHLEFVEHDHEWMNNPNGADVLVLAGDIILAKDLKLFPFDDNTRGVPTGSTREYRTEYYREFFNKISKSFKNIIYVPGNHEYYESVFQEVDEIIESQLYPWSNIHYLNKNAVDINGKVFVGATLWTDFWRSNNRMFSAQSYMNDYRKIRWKNVGYRKLRPVDILSVHQSHWNFIQDMVQKTEEQGKSCIIVTHHGPTIKSCATGYDRDDLTPAYVNDRLEEYIQGWVNVPLMIHGHIHERKDYNIGLTRVVCSPKGYPGELGKFEPLLVEI